MPERSLRQAHHHGANLRRGRGRGRPLVALLPRLGHPLARKRPGHSPAEGGEAAAGCAEGPVPTAEGQRRRQRRRGERWRQQQQRRRRQQRRQLQRQQRRRPALPAAPVHAQATDGGGACPRLPGRAGADLSRMPWRDPQARRHLLRRGAGEARPQEVPRAEHEVQRGLDGGHQRAGRSRRKVAALGEGEEQGEGGRGEHS
mmetsp:Transcript_24286/g.77039  ORF Transcript_24286/g.77039 Transcript_24286/m.77039 type:complete len:201 (+) Transcript_24286:354-956(+)